MTDDTSYFIGFEQYDEAYVAMLYLNSPCVRAFMNYLRTYVRGFVRSVPHF